MMTGRPCGFGGRSTSRNLPENPKSGKVPIKNSQVPVQFAGLPESPWHEVVEEALYIFRGLGYLLDDPHPHGPILVSDGSESLPPGDWTGILFLGNEPFPWSVSVPTLWLRSPSPRQVVIGLLGLATGMYPLENPSTHRSSEGPTIPTPREQEVLDLAAQGLATKQIADQLGVSIPTIKFHLSNLMTKFGAQNRAELVILAAREGYLEV